MFEKRRQQKEKRHQKKADKLWQRRVDYAQFWVKHRNDECARCGIRRDVHRYQYDVDPIYQNVCSKFLESKENK